MRVYINNTFRGGISDEEDRGIRGSFKFGKNLDIHKKLDSLSCQQAMKKDSGTIVTDLILAMVPASDGNSYHFSNTGKIYKRTPTGTWTVIYTDNNGRISGAVEYNNHFYWATNASLSRASLDWATIEHNWRPLTPAEWHSMIAGSATAGVQGGNLFICNKHTLAMVDQAGAFTSEAVRVTPDCIIKCLVSDDTNLIFGTVKTNNAQEGFLYAWNTLILNWRKRKKIPVKGINSLIMTRDILAQAGTEGEIFFSNLVNTLPLLSFGEGKTNPAGVSNKGSLALFGIYGGTNNGLYTYGKTRRNRQDAPNLEYTLSQANITEIGAITTIGTDILVSWQSGATFGVDVVDTTVKAPAVYESLDFDGGSPDIKKLFEHIKITTKPLPVNCGVKVKYRLNKKGDWKYAKLGDGTDIFNIAERTEAMFSIGEEGEVYEVGCELIPHGNTTPEVLSINTYFNFL